MNKLILGLICTVSLVPQTKVDWVTQMKNAPIYDVRAYGAKGNGTANDTVAIGKAMDAAKAAGGGSVFFPKGTYRFVMPEMNYNLYTKYFTNEGSNITVFGTGDGSVLQFESDIGQGLTLGYMRAGVNGYCNSMVPFDCNTSAWDVPKGGGFPVLYHFQPATVGSKTITVICKQNPTTGVCSGGSAAADFTPGMEVRLQSGDNSPTSGHPAQHYEYNQILSVSGSVITLATPLDDFYDNQDAAWPPYISVVSVLPKNIVIRDLKITRTTCRPHPEACSDFDGLLINPGSTRNVLFERVTIVGVGPKSAWWNSTAEGFTVRDSIWDNMPSDLGDMAYNFTLDHNIWKNSPDRTIQVGSTLRNYRITNNYFLLKGVGCCDAAINLNSSNAAGHPSRGVEILNNHIQLAATQYGCGITMYAINDALISGNTITGPNTPAGDGGHCGVGISGGNNIRVANNMVNVSGNQTVGVGIGNADGPLTNIVVEGNNLGVDQFGVRITGATTKATIGCNMTFGNAAAISDGATGTVYTCTGATATALTYYTSTGGSATTAITNLGNHQFCGSFTTPADLQIGHIAIPINTASAANGLDVGIYNAAGNIIAHTGPLNLTWTGFPWPSKPICARNPANQLEACGASGSPIGTFRIPAGKNYWCYLQGDTVFKMAAYGSGAGILGITDYGLNSDPGNCLPGADGSCSPYVLRPQIGPLEQPASGNQPIVILTP